MNYRYKFQGWLLIILALATAVAVNAQRDPSLNGRSGGHSVFGDIRVDETKAEGVKPISLDVTLYTESRNIISRQTVSTNGRYRFDNVPSGTYEVSVEIEGREVARVRIDLTSPLMGDLRQDLAFEWKPIGPATSKTGAISAADRYERTSANAALFEKSGEAINKKNYDESVELLKTLVAADPKDFQAWTELANVHLIQKKLPEAENEFLRALDLHSDFFPALLNLGRLEVTRQNYDVAVEVLNKAVKVKPESVDANYLLGESYLHVKKGSQAVIYLNEALRLDPRGMADVHLRLALLYHSAGVKAKAAAEYEEFLKVRPDYADRKKLEKYITENKQP